MDVGQGPRCVQRPGFNPQVSPHGIFHGRSGTTAGLSRERYCFHMPVTVPPMHHYMCHQELVK